MLTCCFEAGQRAHTQVAGNTRPQSSQPTEPLWTDPGLKSRIGEGEMISTLKKKSQEGNESSKLHPKSRHGRGKKPPPPPKVESTWPQKLLLGMSQRPNGFLYSSQKVKQFQGVNNMKTFLIFVT